MRKLLLIAGVLLLCTCSRPPSALEEVRARGELRVVTRNSLMTYFVGRAGPEGPEYDLVKGFADRLGVKLRVVEAGHFSDLLADVESGQADLAAAGLTITPERAGRVTFGTPYQQVRQQVIYRRGRDAPADVADLVGRRVEVVAHTSYVTALEQARARAPNLAWTEDPNADAADLLARVARGEIDYTVVDSNVFNVFQPYHPELRVAFDLSAGDSLGWAFRRDRDQSLVEAANSYLAELASSGRLAQVMDRYYGHKNSFDYQGTRRFMVDYKAVLPGIEGFFKAAGQRADLDWRLVAAIGYQESQWNPEAQSPKGAGGIMMLTPETADLMGVDDPADASASIMGGAKYFWRMRNRIARLAPAVAEPDLTWMTLAAYNMGYGHFLDARRLTKARGANPDRWVDLRETLPLLMNQRWYSKTKWGYARGAETVAYVRNIRRYYDMLVFLTEQPPDEGKARAGLRTSVSERSAGAPAIATGHT